MSADDKVYTISNIKFAKGGNIDSAVVTADFTKKGYQQSLVNKQKQWNTYKPFLIVMGIALIVIIFGLLFG